VFLNVRLAPNASKNVITGWDGQGALKIRVTAKPVEGRANEALINLLSKELKVPKSAILIKKGLASRNKLLEIAGLGKLPEVFYGQAV
jgi:uncharacterized protein (TIGR00251 family)